MASITQTANPAGVSASSNVATYSGVSIGAAAPDRIIAVVVGSELASTPIASCTIDGNAMTAGTQGNQGAVYARTFYLPYPTGTTANIAVTFTTNSPTSTQNHIAVYRILDAVYSSTGADQSTDMDATDPLTTGSTVIAAGGLMLAVAAGATDTAGKTWANLGEDIDADAGALRFTTAFSTTAGTATRTCTGTTNGEDGALSWLIFNDNSSPTVALNSPADSATGVSTTPVLDFTGTDADSNDVRYNVEVDTASDFHLITLDSNTESEVFPIAGTTEDHTTHTIGSGSNYLIVATIVYDSGGIPTTSGVTWHGVAMTQLKRTTNAGVNVESCLWGLAAPDIGNYTVQATYSATNHDGAYWFGVVSLKNAKQTGQPDSNASTTTSSAGVTTSITTVAKNCWIFDVIGDGSPAMSPVAGQTSFLDQGGSTARGSYKTNVEVGSNSMGWTFTTENFAHSVIALAPIGPTIDAISGTDAGFANPDNGGDTDPFNSGENIQYTVQSALSNSTVYYWRVRGIDPSGSNSYGAWATTRSFTTTSGGGTSVKDLIGSGFIPFAR